MSYNRIDGDLADFDRDHPWKKEYVSHMEDGIDDCESQCAELKDSLSDFTYANSGAHNSFFRGKSLGSSVTSAQASAISGDTYDDLYVGDYWTINSVNYRIGCFDYWYRCGDTSLTTHNALLVPDTRLYTAPMNETNTTDGAYVGSAMYTCEEITVSDVQYTGLANAITTVESAFGSYLLEHQAWLNTTTSSGRPSGGGWQSGRKVDLMTEHMVYGGPVMEQMPSGGTSYSMYRVEKSQLPLFMFAPIYINIRANYWLRDVVSSTTFALVTSGGIANSTSASDVSGVRPYFLIS